ncbi:MAG: DNRLRE domain-containing protein, partial [Bacteroidia bacterium]|nr:DNRLRE domain-containing protein [Bacteroidia bacterium]
MKKITNLILAVMLIVCSTVTAQVTITIKPPQGGLDDATISDNFASSNFGNHTEELLLTWSCSGSPCVGRSIMNFDLSAIPTNSIINSATLYLYADINNAGSNGIPGQPTYGTDNAGWVRRITQSWNENTVTWNTQPSFTTQNEVTLPQSTSTTQDYAATVSALVQDMINNPSSSFGFLVMEKNESIYYNSLIFVSNDNADTARNPKLVITYTPPSGNMTCTETVLDASGIDATISDNFAGSNFGNHTEELLLSWSCSGSPCVG